jgi:hypothetical protein
MGLPASGQFVLDATESELQTTDPEALGPSCVPSAIVYRYVLTVIAWRLPVVLPLRESPLTDLA